MIYLQPGEVCVSDRPGSIVTVLGSCLAVTMWVPRLGIGAICHSYLPHCSNRMTCRSQCRERFKYVHCTIPWMIEMLSRNDIRPSELEIKLFGGGHLAASLQEPADTIQVGQQNAATAMEILKQTGLTVTSQDLGGFMGRKLIFNTGNGEVLVKKIRQRVIKDSNRLH